MLRLLGRFSGRLVVVLVVAGVVGAGIAWASIPDANGVFTACVSMDSGVIRMIDPSLPAANPDSHCLAGLENEISWSQGTPSSSDAYNGNYILEIDGVGNVPVNLTGGCTTVGVLFTNVSTHKQSIGSKQPVPCRISFGQNVPKAFWLWLGKSFAPSPASQAKSVVLTHVDATGHNIGEIKCSNVVPAALGLPSFSTTAGGSFLIQAVLAYSSCTTQPGTGAVDPISSAITPFSTAQTLIEVDGVASNPSATDPLEFDLVNPQGAGTYVAPPTFGLRYAPAVITPVQTWFQDMVVNGSMTTRSIVVSLHSGGVKFTLGGCGINRLSAEPLASDGTYDAGIFANSVAISGTDT